MRTIYKYPVPHIDRWSAFRLEMPSGALFRRFDQQGEDLFIWLEVDTIGEPAIRTYCIVGTGHSIPLYAEYRGTCFAGPFVWHLYEL